MIEINSISKHANQTKYKPRILKTTYNTNYVLFYEYIKIHKTIYFNYSLGIPETNFKGLSTRMALRVLRSNSCDPCGISVSNLIFYVTFVTCFVFVCIVKCLLFFFIVVLISCLMKICFKTLRQIFFVKIMSITLKAHTNSDM